MKALFASCVLLSLAMMVRAAETGAPPLAAATTAHAIVLKTAPPVEDPLGTPSPAAVSAKVEDETVVPDATGEIPLPVLHVEGGLPNLDARGGEPKRHTSKVWVGSVVALLAGTTIDGVSSWGKLEGNPLLRSKNGTFGPKAAFLKAGLAGVVLVPQFLKKPEDENTRKVWTIVNFMEAGVFTGVAAHNLTIH